MRSTGPRQPVVLNVAARVAPACPAPMIATRRSRSGRSVATSDLPLGQPHSDAVEVQARSKLTPESTFRLAGAGSALEHLVLVFADRRQTDRRLIHVDMAGGAHGLTAALSDDPVDSVLKSSPHHRRALGGRYGLP